MNWVDDFDLFLFDFDGLLADTEPLYYEAYKRTLEKWGKKMPWDLISYLGHAHRSSTSLREDLSELFPEFKDDEKWNLFYSDRKKAYIDALAEESIKLMPGVPELLETLKCSGKRRCVVTHSIREHIDIIKKNDPALQSIEHWLTREDFVELKPNPRGYLMAIDKYGESGDRVIGFEDSLRGWKALKGTPAKAVLICDKAHPQLEDPEVENAVHFSTFADIPSNWS